MSNVHVRKQQHLTVSANVRDMFPVFAGKGSKQALANNDEISLVLPKNKGFFLQDY